MMRHDVRSIAFNCSVFACGSTSLAQIVGNGTLEFVFPAGNTYSGANGVEVQLWLSFDPGVYAWAKYSGEIEGSDPSGNWSSMSSAFATLPGTSVGLPTSGSVQGISLEQLHFPLGGIYASAANPIMLWSGIWSSPNLAPRVVHIETDTVSNNVYVIPPPPGPPSLILTEAQGMIVVIPAPGGVLVGVACAVAVGAWRRRE
jgi:hypothetical protein